MVPVKPTPQCPINASELSNCLDAVSLSAITSILDWVVISKNGFLSTVYKIEPIWSDHNRLQKLPKTLAVKLVSMDGMVQSFGLDEETLRKAVDPEKFAENAHRNECIFYSHFASSLALPLIKTYGFRPHQPNSQGVLLMEDLSIHEFTSVDVGQFMTVDQVKSCLDIIAKLQMQVAEKPNLKQAFQNKLVNMNSWEYNMTKPVLNEAAEYLRTRFPIEFTVSTEDIEVVVAKSAKVFDQLETPEHELVLCHGDLWYGNFLFKPDQKNIFSIIDWQQCHFGCPAEDVSRIIGLGLSAKDRRENEEQLLLYFYDQLVSANVTNSKLYSFNYLKEWYKKTLLMCAYIVLGQTYPLIKFGESEVDIKNNLERCQALWEDVKDINI